MPAPLMPPPTTSTSTSRRTSLSSRAEVGNRHRDYSCIGCTEETCAMPHDKKTTCSRSTRARRARARSSSMRAARIVAQAQREFRQIFPQPGWVEHDPMEIWQSQLATAREALAKAKLAGRATSRRSASPTSARRRSSGTAPPASRSATPSSGRTGAPRRRATALKQRGLEPLFRERTGLVLDAYFSGTKLAWLLDHVPGARAAAERGELAFGTVDSWLMWHADRRRRRRRRARRPSTRPTSSNASRTLLFDVPRGDWSDELLARARRAARGAARGPSVEPRLRPHDGRSLRRADRDRRRRRRPAERALRPGVLSRRARSRTPTAPAASC